MAKSSMAEIARIIGIIARLDRHGKQIVSDYLIDELTTEPKPKEPVTYQEREQ